MYLTPLMALAFPIGEASGARGDQLSARYAWQWMPLDVGLGAKLIDELYVGAYATVGLGAEGDDSRTEGRCEAGDGVEDDVSCSAMSLHAGVEAHYVFTPAESMTGFVGYGFGINGGVQTISDAGRYSESTTARGFDWARVSGGLTFRLSRGFGMSPFAMVSLGRYTHQRTEIRNVETSSADISDPAFHAWLALGLRLVIFP